MQLSQVSLICAIFLIGFTHGSQWYCDTDTDCTTQNSFCSAVGLCQCKDGQIFSTDGKSCIPLAVAPGYACTEDRQCTAFIFGPVSCSRDICLCSKGYRYLSANSTCIPYNYLHEDCTEDVDCFDDIDVNAMKCRGNKCVCNDGYYNRADVDCRLTNKVSETCLFDIDCQSETQICQTEFTALGKCVEHVSELLLNDTAVDVIEGPVAEVRATDLGKTCREDSECTTSYSTCSKLTKKCACRKSYYHDAVRTVCVPNIGQPCNGECGVNAECVSGTCHCKPYYINGYLDGKCYKPARALNDSCTDNKNCYSLGRYAVCSDKRCVCRSHQFDEEFMMCILGTSIGAACLEDDQCILDNTECNNGQCLCRKDFTVIDERTCSLELGKSCKGNENYCKVSNASCTSDVCMCNAAFLTLDQSTCIPELTNVTHGCTADLQCTTLISDAARCVDNNCNCTDAYLFQNDTCILKRYLGDACTTRADCELVLAGEVSCRNSQCVCAYGYKNTADGLGCQADNGSVSMRNANGLSYVVLVALSIHRFMF